MTDDQESYRQATRRRQIRIWRNEQEIEFLQNTNAADLERVRAFQQQHSARLIQRGWRAANQSAAHLKGEQAEDIDPSDRVYTFDPFKLATTDGRATQWRHNNEKCVERAKHPPSLLLNKDEIRATTTANKKLPAAIANEKAFESRRKEIQDRIKRKAAQQKINTRSSAKTRASVNCETTENAKAAVNRRRDLYEQVIAMKRTTAQRVLRYDREARVSRQDKELLSAQLVASIENRLKHLRSESPEQMKSSIEDNQELQAEAGLLEKWDLARRMNAWNNHRRAVFAVLDKRHWWQTHLAGDERDIRHVVVAKSPWEDENKIWVWPRGESSNQKEANGSIDPDDSPSATSPWPSLKIQRFLVGVESQNQSLSPVNDDEASEWWRAHCTQSHLTANGALKIDKPYSTEFSNNVTSEGDVFPVCTSEEVANRDLYLLQQRAKRAARTKSLERDIEQRIIALTAQVERRVHEMEVQVEANTQLALELVQRKEEQRARITREQEAAMTIQRYTRGMHGRRCAREQRAEFFVMVRGRAIRRGKCEECGDQRAVLECQQCEESLHFCPICWVHVHSTRRRKTHVAIPMTTVVAPTPTQTVEATPSAAVNTTSELSKTRVTPVEKSTGPRLRALPSPPKHSTTRSVKSAGVNGNTCKGDAKIRSAKSSKHDAAQMSTPVNVSGNTIPELAEACALARRVRAEVDKAPVPTTGDAYVSVHNFAAEDLASEEVDFSTVDGDCAVVNGVDVGSEDQLDTAKKIVQPSPVELVEVSTNYAEVLPLDGPEEKPSGHEVSPDPSVLDIRDKATAIPLEQETAQANLLADPNVDSNSHHGEDNVASITEASPVCENDRPGNSVLAEGTGVANAEVSAETSTPTVQDNEVQETTVLADQGPDASSAIAVAAHELNTVSTTPDVPSHPVEESASVVSTDKVEQDT
ncbi:unnamed protein product [Phytophthora lilii]|uniref:Unnamed protein product n=1 Tax=Phytophthora lilii TaxID=2077276 RepID=A0A9W6TEQ7_9STRA|nr:unnamed protein product [Phytophthora lilii]